MTTELKHPECNGWVIVTKDQVDCDDAANYHLVEAKISITSDGDMSVVYNSEKVTCCGYPLIKNAKYLSGFVYLQDKVNNLRIILAQKQNGSWEICGRCVGHLYKDFQ